MTVIGNRFTAPFVGRRPDGPTPAPPGPDVRFASVTQPSDGRVNITLQTGGGAGDIIDTLAVDWGDGTREQMGAWTAGHSYAEPAVYEIRAIARSTIGRESVNSIRVQVAKGAPTGPDPVADFTISPAAPTTDDVITVDGSPSTPAGDITEFQWQRMAPNPANSYDQPWVQGPLAAGPAVWRLIVKLADGRTSAMTQRTVAITAAPLPEDPDAPEEAE